MKRILSMILCLALVVAMVPISSIPISAAETDATTSSSMCLGSSEITQYSSVYYGKEIPWKVLDPTKTNIDTKGMFLISENIMDNICFDRDAEVNDSNQTSPNEWQYSDAQQWCKNFASETNFSTSELNNMISINKTDTDFDYDGVPYGVSVLKNEKMFFLSALEAVQYFTPLSLGKPPVGPNDLNFIWWLRSPSFNDRSETLGTKDVPKAGIYGISSGHLLNHKVTASGNVSLGFGSFSRPAFNIDTSQITFSSDAINDKAPISASGNGELTSVSVGTPSSWKFTLYDSIRRNFTVNSNKIYSSQGETKTITYSNAIVGTNDYVSAMITNDYNEILYYGKLGLAKSGTNNTAKITIPSSIPEGNYTIKVFNERCNGAKLSDFSSTLKDIPLTVSETPIFENGVYKIASAKHLNWFAKQVNESGNTSINGKIVNDINLDNASFSSIGTLNKPYTGTFDGGGYKISNLKISGVASYQGLIGCAGGNATINNVIIESGSVSGIGYVGGIVGGSKGSGKITIENCVNCAQINATSINAAGIFGCNYESAATVSIKNCGNIGAVTGVKESAAIAGWLGNNGTISGCYNTGTVKGYTASNAFYRAGSNPTINNNYNLNTIGNDTRIPTKNAAQFASGEVCYLLNASSSDENAKWHQNIDIGTKDSLPLLDSTHGMVHYGYVNCIATNKIYSNNPTSSKMGDLHSYDDYGICIYCGKSMPVPLVNGVYQISNAWQLNWFAGLVNGTLTDGTAQNMAANAKLTADINITSTGFDFTPIACASIYDSIHYAGTFDGNGHSITGLKSAYYVSAISNEEYSFFGLFGYIDGGTVKNLDFSGEIFGYFTTGMLCGLNRGTIENCSVTGKTLNSEMTVGVICGENYGTIKNCFATEVNLGTQGANISNIAGRNIGTITNCYYLATSETDSISGTTHKTQEQFSSGEVTYLLNGGKTDKTQKWHQKLGTDKYPKLTGNSIVYKKYDGTYNNSITYLLGDCTQDGIVNISDATAIQKYLAGVIDFSDTQLKQADVDKNGFDVSDASLITGYCADIIDNEKYGIGNVLN